MTRRAAVVAMAVVAMVPALGSVADAKGGAKRKISLFVEGTGCAHDFEAKPVRLKKEKLESLGLRIENTCNVGRKALLCAYDADGRLSNPFDACTSVPPGLDIASPFSLTATGGKAEMDCAAKNAGSYVVLALVGDEIKGASCPATPPRERMGAIGDRTFVHRLAVEIVP
jgi:hypothetical protein